MACWASTAFLSRIASKMARWDTSVWSYSVSDVYKRQVEYIPENGRKLMEAFWPGTLTMIFPKSPAVPYGTTGGLDTVAIRMPSDPVANRLIALAGVPVAAPSANTSGRPSPTTADHVWQDMNGRIDMIIDGGPVGIGVAVSYTHLDVYKRQVYIWVRKSKVL